MELTSQVANLQDEVKLLKGEIKAVLKEIRTAVLSENNPFTLSVTPPAPPGGEWPKTAAAAGPQPAATPDIPPAAPAAGPAAGPFDPSPQPAAPIPIGPFAQAQPAPATPASAPNEPPVEHHSPMALPHRPEPEPVERPWGVLTIAGLAAWTEDTLESLGPRRFRLLVELAGFAEILPAEMRDALCGFIPAKSPPEQEGQSLTLNEALLALHHLEAILQGDAVGALPRRRRGRHARMR